MLVAPVESTVIVPASPESVISASMPMLVKAPEAPMVSALATVTAVTSPLASVL